ncbi:DNA-binding transcriptional LysR family regulator [Amaricoccus macauensis]|uniref:DNA-binding transcriptional LysR family regulator n=1 Tax=Amaricoccus macauensis TaxID=57001 RepID=A0A840SXA4_9RHOB|nr:DNA-binding transcriptional LysR family regulator [Amaricoccus macauensis]
MNVTVRQLRAFLAVADLRHFRRAADRLSLSQSAVSMLVSTLEAEVGQRLFDRHNRMVTLTAAGQEFLPQAQRIVEELEAAVSGMRAKASLRRGSVTVAASIVLAATYLPPVVAAFRARWPAIEVRVRDMPEEEIRPAITSHAVDLAIGTISGDEPDIAATPLLTDRLVVICRSDHRFAVQPSIRWAELAGEPLIGLAKGNPLRSIVDRTLAVAAPTATATFAVRFSTTAISMVGAGLGVAVLPENTSQLAPQVRVTAVPLTDPVVSRDASLLSHRHRTLSTAAAAMRSAILAAPRTRIASRRPEDC